MATKAKVKKRTDIELFKNYPIIDGHRKHYILYPVQKKNGKWVAVEVLLPSGYISPEGNPTKVEFEGDKVCQKACDHHNKFHGWTKEEVHRIIDKSMNNVKVDLTVNQLMVLLDIYRGTVSEDRHMGTFNKDLNLLVFHHLIKFEEKGWYCTAKGSKLVSDIKEVIPVLC